MTTKMIEKLINKEILSGAFLLTASCLETEQKHWDDDDLCKNFDFSGCHYWITYNDSAVPDGIDDDQDLLNFLSETKNLKNFVKFYFQK